MRVSIILAAAALATAEFLPQPSAAAIYYQWCSLWFNPPFPMTYCGFVTWDQCVASFDVGLGNSYFAPESSYGVAGYCYAYPNPFSVYRSKRRHPSH
jgi:hypothetical protein